jgi:hypothetical protein
VRRAAKYQQAAKQNKAEHGEIFYYPLVLSLDFENGSIAC